MAKILILGSLTFKRDLLKTIFILLQMLKLKNRTPHQHETLKERSLQQYQWGCSGG